ncbi:hypothetical protein M4I32_07905 [Microbacterium sp. LRZ72]|uniref:hypothetical protein n=1 Tax=Microbacterium sp. LRZ72 TaxID=2942481 RepID=UPI0029A137B2|nr:hypothetical protein [Microbacterium sp. LRZ72]MDX2376722.1 hypothetical protein [Microbacterium sp. LRZ72]
MKHITYAEKSLLIGDEAADLLVEYAAAVAAEDTSDTVALHAFGADGQEVSATFVLNSGTNLMAETVSGSMSEPDNTDAVRDLRRKHEELTRGQAPPGIRTEYFDL